MLSVAQPLPTLIFTLIRTTTQILAQRLCCKDVARNVSTTIHEISGKTLSISLLMYKYFLAPVCVLIMVACGNNTATNKDADLRFDGDTISVKENSSLLEQITVQKAQLQDFEAEFRTVGTVRPVAGKLAEIAPPFAG
jgi:hypothetical protein